MLLTKMLTIDFSFIAWHVIGRPIFSIIPYPFFKFRVLLLRLFGANLHITALIYPSANIFSPKNLIMKEHSCLSRSVDCYNENVVQNLKAAN